MSYLGYAFIAGWVSCRGWTRYARARRQGKSVVEAIAPVRGERQNKKVPNVSEVG